MQLQRYFNYFLINIICVILLISCAKPQNKTNDSLNLLMQVGNSATATGNYNIAIPIYQRANQIAPQDPKPLVALGDSYSVLGEYEYARVAYTQALEVDQHNITALRGLIKSELLLNNPKNAGIDMQKVLEKQPKDAETLNMLGILLDLNSEHKQAQSCYLAGLRNTSNKVMLYNNYAVSLALAGNHNQALSVLAKARAGSNNPQLVYNIDLIKTTDKKISAMQSTTQKDTLRKSLANKLLPMKDYSTAGKAIALELNKGYCK